jgi:hypothetical protein
MKRLSIFLIVLLMAIYVSPIHAESPDFDTKNGHFFTQAGRFSITNDGVPFWQEFQRLGGVQAMGYPISERFTWNGFTCQAMQRVIFQWNPQRNSVDFVNVFDLLHQDQKDGWLWSVRQTPYPLSDSFDAGLDWNGVVANRLALLDTNQAIKTQYFSVVGDPIVMNGLPTSPVIDMGNCYVIRCQRVVIQQWKFDVPWAKAGQVTVANGGDIAKEACLIPPVNVPVVKNQDPPLYSYYSFDVDRRSTHQHKINVTKGQVIEGNFFATGGNNDIGFRLLTPSGDRLDDIWQVRGTFEFRHIATYDGTYTLIFDNSYSLITKKLVSLQLRVY